jgi:hypothetical protein
MNTEDIKRIEGGKHGIQYISKGSQQFATDNNFLFITTNESKQSFHVKTSGGIMLENKKNKIHLQENGILSELLYIDENILGDSRTVIGGNYSIRIAEKRGEYHLQMNKGRIKHTDFHLYHIIGDTIEIDVAKFMVKRGEYGIDWENDLIISNPSKIKCMSLNGDIHFSTKNGERIIFENEKPNGLIEFKGEKSLINTRFAKMEHESLQINSHHIQINKSILLDEDIVEIISDMIKLGGSYLEIGCIKMREGMDGGDSIFRVKTDNIQFEAGNNNKIEITKDKISLIGEGNLGIMLIGGKSGIKMQGNIQWIHLDNILIQTDDEQKILSIGNKFWKLKLEGEVEIENCTLIGENKRISGDFMEIIGKSCITWQIRDKKIQITNNGIVFENGVNKIEIGSDYIKETGRIKRIEFAAIEEIGIEKMENWDKLGEKGESKQCEWEKLEEKCGLKKCKLEKLENNGNLKKEIWENVEDIIGNYQGIIREKYGLMFGEDNGIYWDGEKKLEIKGVFIKDDKHTIFGGNNKLVIENDEIEIRNCLKSRENELIIGVGKKKNHIFLNEDIILLGNKRHHIAIYENKIQLGDFIRCNNGNQVFIGDIEDAKDQKEKKIIMGINNNLILIDEKQLQFVGKKVYLLGIDSIQIDGKITRIQGESIGIGSNETNCIEFIGKKILYKKGDSQIELNDSFTYMGGGIDGDGTSKFYVGKKGVIIESDDTNFKLNVNTKAPIHLHSSRNITMESTIGDIQIKNHTSQIFMNQEDNMLGIWSDGNIWGKGKKIIIDGEKIEINTKNIGIDVKMDMDIHYGRKLEIFGGKEIEFQSKEVIKFTSDIFGEITIGENSGIHINKSLDVQIGENYTNKIGGNLVVNIDGALEYRSAKGMKIYGGGIGKIVEIESEENMRLYAGENLNFGGKNIGIKCDIYDVDISKQIKLSGNQMTVEMKQLRFQQRGFGEMSWESDGKIRIVSKIEGNRGDVMEFYSESNTHEKSIYAYSRMGGIYLEGQTIGLVGGKIRINGVELIGGENKLNVAGIMEVHGLKIGKNMFIEPRGISLLQREELELRNMDIKLGGRMEMEMLKVKKIQGALEIDGKLRIIGGIDSKGGITGDGYKIGNWEIGNRSCLKIDMKDTIWNEGIHINGGGCSIMTDGDIVCGGGGKILIHSLQEGRENQSRKSGEIRKLLEEVTAMGESGTWDVGCTLQKLVAIVGILAADKEE